MEKETKREVRLFALTDEMIDALGAVIVHEMTLVNAGIDCKLFDGRPIIHYAPYSRFNGMVRALTMLGIPCKIECSTLFGPMKAVTIADKRFEAYVRPDTD